MHKRLLAATALLTLITFAHTNASPDERTLKLVNTHTGEKATITFKRNGNYVPEGLKQLNHILRDWRLDKEINMDPKLFDVIWETYQETGATEPINIICGYRAPDTNEYLRRRTTGVAKNSQHINGKAMDFFIPGVPLAKLREIGLRLQAGGVGFYPTSGSPFVHLDTGSVRHWPAMTRDQLVKVFPEGHTLHIPSDGKPLPGYAEALAEYKAHGQVTTPVMVAGRDTPAVTTTSTPSTKPDARTLVAANVPVPTPKPAVERDTRPADAAVADKGTEVAANTVGAKPAPAPASTDTAKTAGNKDLPVLAFASATSPVQKFDPLRILRGDDAGVMQTAPAGRSRDMAPSAGSVLPGWRDPIARLTKPSRLTTAFWTVTVSVRQAGFGSLTSPKMLSASALFDKPAVTYAGGFAPTVYPGLRTDRFSGSLAKPLPMVVFQPVPATLASR